MARLVPVEGIPLETFVWRSGVRTIGRGSECDIIVRHSRVSRIHCRIEIDQEGSWLVDCKSSNGTYLNGRRVLGTHSLTSGDIIDVGGWKARFELGEVPEYATFVIQTGEHRRTVRGSMMTIGRASSADVVIRDPSMSRVHATISYSSDFFVIRDSGSTNGTYVGGRRTVTKVLADGDIIAFSLAAAEDAAADPDPADPDRAVTDAQRPVQVGLGPRNRIRVAIADDTCTLTVGAFAVEDEHTQEFPLPVIELDGHSASHALTRLIAIEEVPHDTGPMIIHAPVRGKARYQGGRWVPTSDISPARGLRAGVLAIAAVATMAGGAALLSARSDVLSTGSLQAGHMSTAFAEQVGDRDVCGTCHTPWQGVTDVACTSCHDKPVASPHTGLKIACASCHREHHGASTVGDVSVGRHRCVDCHVDAHVRRIDPDMSPALTFLNRGFSATLVHTDHRSLTCFDCHAKEGDGSVAKQVLVGCAGCHGGAAGLSDARCMTCHPYHTREE